MPCDCSKCNSIDHPSVWFGFGLVNYRLCVEFIAVCFVMTLGYIERTVITCAAKGSLSVKCKYRSYLAFDPSCSDSRLSKAAHSSFFLASSASSSWEILKCFQAKWDTVCSPSSVFLVCPGVISSLDVPGTPPQRGIQQTFRCLNYLKTGMSSGFVLVSELFILSVRDCNLLCALGQFADECEAPGKLEGALLLGLLRWIDPLGLGVNYCPNEGVQVSWGLVHKWGWDGAWDWQVDWCNVSRNGNTVLDCWGEERVEPEGEAIEIFYSKKQQIKSCPLPVWSHYG